jgi:beta-glucosidase
MTNLHTSNDTNNTIQSLAAAFPPHFLWGTATASYQIEGAATEDGRTPSIWDTFSKTPGKVSNGDTGDVAADHYHRMPEDVALMARLGTMAYRFSVAWPRILPSGRGQVNEKGLDFYDRLVDTLLAQNIRPFVTLYHWDLPQALQDQGGWLSRDTANAFADYAEIVAQRLGNRVTGWITLNEPWCSAYLGYAAGIHAPGMRDRQAAIQVAHHLLLAHGLAVPRVRASMKPDAQVGITLNFSPIYPVDERVETQNAVQVVDAFANRWFLDPLYGRGYPKELFDSNGLTPPTMQDGDMQVITTPTDFLGVNNYSRFVIRARQQGQERQAGHGLGALFDNEPFELVSSVEGASYTEMGWEVYPNALHDILLRLHRDYAVPALYVTENGAAFADVENGSESIADPQRISFLRDYIGGLTDLFPQGVPLKGYFVWSLIDNFEWAEGYSKRFGIVYVDYPTGRRILKESALWYANLIAAYKQAHP